MYVIQDESQQCLNIINGGEINTKNEWPSQYTWSLLSRICFTFGNLTNTNIRNRELLGIKYNCMEHLYILLQACVGALDQIIKGIRQSQHQNNDSSDMIPLETATESTEHELWDATTKMLRLLLNLCINDKIGRETSNSSDLLQVSQDI